MAKIPSSGKTIFSICWISFLFLEHSVPLAEARSSRSNKAVSQSKFHIECRKMITKAHADPAPKGHNSFEDKDLAKESPIEKHEKHHKIVNFPLAFLKGIRYTSSGW